MGHSPETILLVITTLLVIVLSVIGTHNLDTKIEGSRHHASERYQLFVSHNEWL